MSAFAESFATAAQLIVHADPVLLRTVALSLQVSGSACLIAAGLGLALGAWLAVAHFPGHRLLVLLLNTLLALPAVLVGLVVYLLLSRSGPLGAWGILFTPTAMVIAQTLLKTKDGSGRVAAHEIMIGTPAIRNLIRENKVAQMYSSIQTGGNLGMQTLDQCLQDLVKRNVIAPGAARAAAQNKDAFFA